MTLNLRLERANLTMDVQCFEPRKTMHSHPKRLSTGTLEFATRIGIRDK